MTKKRVHSGKNRDGLTHYGKQPQAPGRGDQSAKDFMIWLNQGKN